MVVGGDIAVRDGKDRWLFLERFGSNAYLRSAQTIDRWVRTELPKHVANYVARFERMRERNIPFLLVFPPEASGIYSDMLPDDLRIGHPTACEILGAELRARGVPVVVPSEALRKARGPVDVCHRLDSHWSPFGAFLCYRQIMRALGEPYDRAMISWQEVLYEEKVGFGDLGVHASPERRGYLQECEIPGRQSRSEKNVFDVRERNMRRSFFEGGNGRLLVYRDSFTNALAPFFERTFAETILIAPSPSMPDSAIAQFKPDCVILEVAERALFQEEGPFADWSTRSFAQEYLEIATNERGGKLQAKAAAAITAGKPQDGIELAKSAIAAEGEEARQYNLAWALFESGAHQACHDLIASIPEERRDPFLHYLEAQANYFFGRRDEAIGALDKALAVNPDHALLLVLKGEWLSQSGRIEESAETLKKALRYAPLHEPAWLLTMEMLRQSEKVVEADRLLEHKERIFDQRFEPLSDEARAVLPPEAANLTELLAITVKERDAYRAEWREAVNQRDVVRTWLEGAHAESASLREQLTLSGTFRAELDDRLSNEKLRCADLEAEIADGEYRRTQLTQSLGRSEARRVNLQTKLQIASKSLYHLNRLTEQLDDFRQACAALEGQLLVATSELKDRKAETRDLTARHENLMAEAGRVEQLNRDLTDRLTTFARSFEELQGAYDTAISERDELAEKIRQASDALQQMVEESATLRSTVGDFWRDLNASLFWKVGSRFTSIKAPELPPDT